MAHKRVKSSRFPGVYWRETTDPKRRHNGRLDRCYDYCIREAGKLKWVAVGWASEGCSEQLAANRRRTALERVARHGTEIERVLLSEIAVRYFSWMESEGKYVKSERSRFVNHVAPILGAKVLSDISREDVARLKARLMSRGSASSAKKILSCCRAMINHAVRMGIWQGINPFGSAWLNMPRPNDSGERFLSQEEARALLDELERRSPQLRDMAWLSLKTGLRSTEIFRLTGADVDATAGVLWVTSKGLRRVPVRVDAAVIGLLQSYERAPGQYVFQSREGGKLTQISDTFERACAALGLMPHSPEERRSMDPRKKVWFHTLRHTFASWLAQSGRVTLYELRDLLRHKSITMTERYAHLIPAQVQAKAAIIDEMLKSKPPA